MDVYHSYKPWYTLCVLAGFIVLCATEKLPPQITALVTLMAVFIPSIISPEEALKGFANNGILGLAAMLIIASFVEKATWLSKMMFKLLDSERLEFSVMRMCILVIVTSTFMNNAAVVSLYMPFIAAWCYDRGVPVSKVYLPLSFSAVVGGMNSLIGTSTSLMIAGMAKDDGIELPMFESAKIGLVLSVAVIIYIVAILRYLPGNMPGHTLLGARLLGGHSGTEFLALFEVTEAIDRDRRAATVSELLQTLEMPADAIAFQGKLCGLQIESDVTEKLNTSDREAFRDVDLDARLSEGDKFCISCPAEKLGQWFQFGKLNGVDSSSNCTLLEVRATDRNPFIGKEVFSKEFREAFKVRVVGLHRHRFVNVDKFSIITLRKTDVLLLELDTTEESFLLEHSANFEVGKVSDGPQQIDYKKFIRSYNDWLPVMGLIVYVTAVALKAVNALLAATALAFLLNLCLNPGKKEFLDRLNGSVLFVAACMNGFSYSVQSSGLAHIIADLVVMISANTWIAFSILTFIGCVLTEFINNNACGAIMYPIGITLSRHLNANPMPFIVASYVASAIGYMNPLADNSHLITFEAGKYTFKEFAKFGFGCDLVLLAITCCLMGFMYFV